MLSLIHIENLALMGRVRLQLEKGFTAITGETGAGKSALLGGLKLLAGYRADKVIIHPEAEACVAEALIQCGLQSPIHDFLQTYGLPACEAETLVLRRVMHRTKGPVIQINGALVTLSLLRALGQLWIDFQEAGESQRLMDEAYQLELLDNFIQAGPLQQTYAAQYAEWKRLIKQLEAFKAEGFLDDDTLAFLNAQLAKLQSLPLSSNWVQALELQFTKLSRRQEWMEACHRITEGLEGEGGVTAGLAPLLRHAQSLSDMDLALCQPLAQRLQGLLIECTDISNDYQQLTSDEGLEPEAAALLNERMQAWMELKRKYGPSVEAVLSHRQVLEEKIARYANRDSLLQELEGQIQGAHACLKVTAEALTQKRLAGAPILSQAIAERLKSLGFKNPQFQIAIAPEPTLRPYGDSRCLFWFSPNQGQALLPFNKTTSAGEAARVLLALKDVLAGLDKTPVLVFDEADANIGGEIASEVAAVLKRLSSSHQILCVTHLAQVASQAQNHLVVEKELHETQAAIAISPLHTDKPKRIAELARMLGDRNAASVVQHAEALLARA